jgi:hypothetical protein
MRRARFFSSLVVTTVLVANAARAQTPAEAAKVDKAKPQEAAAAPQPAPASDFQQEAQVTAGALFNDGNVSALVGRVGGYWQMKYLVHGVRLEAGAGLASLAQDPDADPSDGFDVPLGDAGNRANTTANARARYDFFLSPNDSLYASGFAFHDSAANLLTRLRADLGYRRFFFNVEKHSLTGEVGAVYTIDSAPVGADTNKDGVIDLNDETGFEKSGGTYGARFAVAYTNALLDNVSYTTTFEVVPNIFPDVDAPFEAARSTDHKGDNKLGFGEATIATWNNALTFNVNTNLNVGLNVAFLYDNGAVARRNAYTNHDLAVAFQLGYKLF